MSNNRQIEFADKSGHNKTFEYAMLGVSIICAIVVLILVLFTDVGNTFRPQI